jgi:transcriptional regulator with XRE-family HTH domain
MRLQPPEGEVMTPTPLVVPMTRLQELLRAEIVATGISQTELAQRTGFSAKHISAMMTGRSQGKLTAWQALLDAAGVDLG